MSCENDWQQAAASLVLAEPAFQSFPRGLRWRRSGLLLRGSPGLPGAKDDVCERGSQCAEWLRNPRLALDDEGIPVDIDVSGDVGRSVWIAHREPESARREFAD